MAMHAPRPRSRISFPRAANVRWVDRVEGQCNSSTEAGDIPLGPRTGRCSPDRGGFRWLSAETNFYADSPKLWNKVSPPAAVTPAADKDNAKMISQYQREILAMVRGLPESDYELSLKDMVDLYPWEDKDSATAVADVVNAKKRYTNRESAKVASTETEKTDLLKLLFPLPGGWRRSSSTGTVGPTVSFKVEDRAEKRQERVRWNKSQARSQSSSSGSESSSRSSSRSSSSSTSSSTSTSTSDGSRRRSSINQKRCKWGGCYFFSSSTKN